MRAVLLALVCAAAVACVAADNDALGTVAKAFLLHGARSELGSRTALQQMHEVTMQENNEAALKLAKEFHAEVVDVPRELAGAQFLEVDASSSRTGFLIKAGKKLFGAGKKLKNKITGGDQKPAGQIYEDCMGCRFIWKQVEMDVSNARYVEDVQASFEHNCLDAQKSEIFYKVCEDMYDDMYALTDDYMSNDWTTDQMCQRAKLCKDPKGGLRNAQAGTK